MVEKNEIRKRNKIAALSMIMPEITDNSDEKRYSNLFDTTIL